MGASFTSRAFAMLAPTTVLVAVLDGCGSTSEYNQAVTNSPAELTSAVAADLTNQFADKIVTNEVDPAGKYTVDYRLNLADQSDVRKWAEYNALDVIKIVKRSTVPVHEIVLRTWFPVTDTYGHTSTLPVVSVDYAAQDLAQMNPDGMTHDNMLKVATAAIVQPGF